MTNQNFILVLTDAQKIPLIVCMIFQNFSVKKRETIDQIQYRIVYTCM